MILVYKFNIGENENISFLCKISNNLYNQALYIFRETLSKEDKWLSYFELDDIMKNTKNLDGDINYKLLKAQCSQQVLRILDKNIKSYYKSVQDYKKHPTKYKEKPGLPNYKKRGYEFNLYYTSQSCKIKDGKIILSKDISIPIPQYEKYSDLIKDFKQIRIKPLACGYKIEIIYEVKDTEVSKGRKEKVASIDLGIDNLATLISEDFAVLFSGKFVKSYNQLFNKTLAKLNSIKDLQKIKGTTRRIKKLYYDREQYIEDVFHKISRKIVDLLIDSKITKLIVGYNKGWKQNVNMGKRNNQKKTQKKSPRDYLLVGQDGYLLQSANLKSAITKLNGICSGGNSRKKNDGERNKEAIWSSGQYSPIFRMERTDGRWILDRFDSNLQWSAFLGLRAV